MRKNQNNTYQSVGTYIYAIQKTDADLNPSPKAVELAIYKTTRLALQLDKGKQKIYSPKKQQQQSNACLRQLSVEVDSYLRTNVQNKSAIHKFNCFRTLLCIIFITLFHTSSNFLRVREVDRYKKAFSRKGLISYLKINVG